MGRPSAPEKLLRVMMLRAFYFDALEAAIDGADRVQPVVSLVRRFRRPFSSSSARSRLASDTSRPPNLDFHL